MIAKWIKGTRHRLKGWLQTTTQNQNHSGPCNEIDGDNIAKHQFPTMPIALVLEEKHLKNARVLPTRDHILPLLPKGGFVAEVGVALGDFSEKIFDVMKPEHFWAIDIFELHHLSELWGKTTKEIFLGKSHEEFFKERFEAEINACKLTTLKGLSHDVVKQLEDQVFDMIYIDAGHDYESVKQDINAYKHKLKPEGFLVMNDYIMFDHVTMNPYGVVQATNEFCIAEDWEIIYFALQKDMFCDVVLRKI